MNVDPETFIRLTEKAGSLAFWDIESNNLKADYGSVLCVAVKPYGKKATTFVVEQPGNDSRVVREARDYLNSFDGWVTYYGKGFDVPFVNTRLLRHKQKPLALLPHVDLFFQLKPKTLMGSKSMASYAAFLKSKHQKTHIDPDVWSDINWKKENMEVLVDRCVSDVNVLQDVFDDVKHLIRDIKR